MEPPLIIVIQPAQLESYAELSRDGELVIAYRLLQSYSFRTPHFAKVVHLSGTKIGLLISTSVTEPQPANGATLSIIGTNHVRSNTYVPLRYNALPFSGFITFKPLPGQAKFRDISCASKLTIILHIVSARFLHNDGARGSIVL